MKRNRFTEEQIIAVLREHEAGAKTADLCAQARHFGSHAVQLEGQIRRHGGVGRQASAVAGRGEPQAEEALGGVDAGPSGAERASDKKCMVRPGVARSFVLLSEAACVNVSGLSRVSCCCSQAMMRCARIVPKKWYEQKELDFLTGLTMRRSTVPTSVLGPRN